MIINKVCCRCLGKLQKRKHIIIKKVGGGYLSLKCLSCGHISCRRYKLNQLEVISPLAFRG